MTHFKKGVRRREKNEEENGKCLGSDDAGPALHPVSQHLQTDRWGLGKYRVSSVKGSGGERSAAGPQLCGGDGGWGVSPNLTRGTELGC